MKTIDKENLKLIAIIWGVTAVLAVAAYNFAVIPQTLNKQSFEKQLADKKNLYEFAQNMADEKKRQQLDSDMEKLRSELDKYVIGFQEASNLTFDISKIATEKKVSSFSIMSNYNSKNKAIKNSKDIYENKIKIKFDSGFNQFAAMLNALERHQPVFFINSFKIRSVGKTNKKSVDMDISFFMKKGQEG